MSTFIHQPKDKLFKVSLSELGVATEFLKAHLPKKLLNKIDLSSLKLEKHGFIDETYKANEADIVYSVQLNQEQAYIYHILPAFKITSFLKKDFFILNVAGSIFYLSLRGENIKRFPPLKYPRFCCI